MASIVDDFTPIYNAIINPIIEKRKKICAGDTSNEDEDMNEIDCNYIYNINNENINYHLDNGDTNYFNNIKKKAENFEKHFITTNDENTSELNNKNELERRIKNINDLKSNYEGLEIILQIIRAGILFYLAYVFFIQAKETTYTKSILNGLVIIPITFLVFDLIISIFLNRKNDLNADVNSLNTIKDQINVEVITSLTNYQNDTNINEFLTMYNEIKANNLIHNKYSKNEKINSMNEIFTELKSIIYVSDNKFGDLIINNQDQVECLMNLITNKGDNTLTLNTECGNNNLLCNTINKCGFYGLYNRQKSPDSPDSPDFKNGLENINGDMTDGTDGDANLNDIEKFYDIIQNQVINSSIETTLKNLPVFKTINNIFMIKIKYYGIKRIEFIKYIYKYFNNKKESNLSKTDLINNYKTLINIIYEKYKIYTNINETEKYSKRNIISKYRFTEIINKFSSDELFKLTLKLEKTIRDIEEYKKIYKDDIIKENKHSKNENKNLLNFFIVLFISTFFKSVDKTIDITSDGNENTSGMVLKLLTLYTVVLFVNSLVFSFWQKSNIDNIFKESLIFDSNDKFTSKLQDLHSSLNNLYYMKNGDLEKLESLLSEKNISTGRTGGTGGNEEYTLYSKYNTIDDYTILDSKDVSNMIAEDVYDNIGESMKIYECCSFLHTREKKKITLPYHEIILNIIYIIITGIVLLYLITDEQINPKKLFENIFPNNIQSQKGGAIQIGDKPIGENLEYVIYILIIFLVIKFTRLLYTGNREYEKSLYQ